MVVHHIRGPARCKARFRAPPLLFMAMCVLLAVGGGKAAGLEAGRPRHVVLGYYDAKPSCFRDERGEPGGIFIEVMRLLAPRLGWEVEYRFATWDGLLSGLRDGSVDLVPAIVRTTERSVFAVFTEQAVMTDWGALFVKRGQGRVGSILELGGRKVGALKDDFWFSGPGALRDLCASFGVLPDYVYYPDYSSLFEALAQGEVEAAAGSNSLGLIWQQRLPIAATPAVYNPIDLRFAGSRKAGGEALVEAIDQELSALKASDPGALAAILGSWQVPDRREYVAPVWLTVLLGVLGAVALVLLAVSIGQILALRRSNRAKEAALGQLRETGLALESSLGEKEVLVHELAHRVKNNLQLILSLLGLADDGKEELLEGLRRKVHSLALAEEEILTRSAIDEESVRRLVESVMSRACSGHHVDPAMVRVEVDLGGGSLAASAAAPLAIMVAELVSNACVHGRGGDGSLDASVSVALAPGRPGLLRVVDAGTGLRAGLEVSGQGHLGFALVSALASQLGGRLSAGPAPTGSGTEVTVAFPPSLLDSAAPGQDGLPRPPPADGA